MKEVKLKIPNHKFHFFMELIKSLDFVKVEEEPADSPYDPEFVAKIQQSEKEFEEGNYTSVEKKDLKDLLGL